MKSSPPRVLGVVPARGGSKRVPRKNLRQLCGKPLIQWTIEATSGATKLTDWVVSTEDCEIGRVANELGAYVVRRPDSLAGDEVSSGAVLRHALDWMETEQSRYDMVVCLHPTSPIRDPKHIDDMITDLSEMPWADNAASVRVLLPKTHPTLIVDRKYQTLGMVLNASIYVLRRDWLVKHGSHVGGETYFYAMDRRHSLDIDEEIDLKIAELFLAAA